jgi:lysyl-tRNA synthetase class 2
MNREALLAKAAYPEFVEGKRKRCRRILLLNQDQMAFADGGNLKLSKKAQVRFASQEGSWADFHSLFRSGDWVGVHSGADGKVVFVELLSPRLKEKKEPSVSRETLAQWNLFLRTVRRFFDSKGFLEVQTPSLVVCPGTEPHLQVFRAEFRQGRSTKTFFLPTSPELHLKKLVAAGYGPLYEIKVCYRNGEISDLHQPEFWMLEWYRPGQNLQAIRKDCVELVRFCAKALGLKAPAKADVTTMRGLFSRHLGFDLRPLTTRGELAALASSLGISFSGDSDFDDLFYLLFLEKVEPKIDSKNLVFVHDYPPSQAALARLTDEGWGDRFEMYWRGMEIANAYHELNDPRLQRERSQEDLQKRELLKKETVPLDEDFFRALEAGMPPSAGIALGLERLFLALTGRRNLQEIRLFPLTGSEILKT